MSPNELKKLKAELDVKRGAKWELALTLGVDPSKITKALSGLVKDELFMARLQASATNILKRKKQTASA